MNEILILALVTTLYYAFYKMTFRKYNNIDVVLPLVCSTWLSFMFNGSLSTLVIGYIILSIITLYYYYFKQVKKEGDFPFTDDVYFVNAIGTVESEVGKNHYIGLIETKSNGKEEIYIKCEDKLDAGDNFIVLGIKGSDIIAKKYN